MLFSTHYLPVVMVWLWLGCSQYGIVGKDESFVGIVPEDTTTTEDWRGGWLSLQLGECVWIYSKNLPEIESTCQEINVNWQMIVKTEVSLDVDDSIVGGFYNLYSMRKEEHSFVLFSYQFSGMSRNEIYAYVVNDEMVVDRFFDSENESTPDAKFAIIKMVNDIYVIDNFITFNDDMGIINLYNTSTGQENRMDRIDFVDMGFGWVYYNGYRYYNQYGIYDMQNNFIEMKSSFLSNRTAIFAQDINLDGIPELINGNRIWNIEDQTWTEFQYTGNLKYIAPINVGGVGMLVYGIDSRLFLKTFSGDDLLLSDQIYTSMENLPVSIGDVTGDGQADIVIGADDTIYVFDAQGNILHQWRSATLTIDLILADLNGDNIYEIIHQNLGSLTVYSGVTGDILINDPSIQGSSLLAGSIAADVDEDGSMEIVTSGKNEAGEAVIRIYGPATGRWARGRSVWNQYPYDISSVDEDGRLIPYPIPGWKAYSAFRAQPAHDGKRPDLQPVLLGACVPDCAAGEVLLSVGVQNTGAAEADSATVRLHTFVEGRWSVVAETAVGRLGAMDGTVVALPVDAALWGEQQLLEVEGDEEECNRINDRVEITFDLCDPPESLGP